MASEEVDEGFLDKGGTVGRLGYEGLTGAGWKLLVDSANGPLHSLYMY